MTENWKKCKQCGMTFPGLNKDGLCGLCAWANKQDSIYKNSTKVIEIDWLAWMKDEDNDV